MTTGISAADRSRTIQVAIDPEATARDIVTPGHVFPLAARDGGVLVRTGHTEAAVDISRLAGLNPSAVICEIMNDDGTMARLPDLIAFAQLHGMKIGTIEDLISYRRRTEKLIEKVLEEPFESRTGGEFRLVVYANTVAYAEHIALVKGDVSTPGPVLVRMHSVNILDDVLGRHGVEPQPRPACQHGGDRARGQGCDRADPRRLPDIPQRQAEGPAGGDAARWRARVARLWHRGADIARPSGVSEMTILSNNPMTVVGLEGYDFENRVPPANSGTGIMSDKKLRILLIEAPYYTDIAARPNCTVRWRFSTPPAPRRHAYRCRARWKFPPRSSSRLEGGNWDGYVTLGCVIRGETTHYDIVCNECARGVQNLAIEHGLAVGFGVLTVEDEEQAWVRAKQSEMDKGGETARACLAMIALRNELAGQ